jgi:hypothetical protein
MKMNKLIFGIIFIFVSIGINSDNSNEEIQPGWIRYDIMADGFTPFAIDLPESYKMKIGNRGTNGELVWVIHEITFNNRQIGGIFIGNFEPDYVLWGINQNDLEYILVNISNSQYQIRMYNNKDQKDIPGFPYKTNDKYVFETCLINFIGKEDEKYFHIWGKTNDENVKNNLLKAFSAIKK